ncbi:protein kinase domain-containing protein [Streptomyces sp. FR-108]|uniref:serine/threonine-protein kinase n=1 Tax=Streptomyces sp. FR-108 TaxID=3416665 RepID=UPI003CF61C94
MEKLGPADPHRIGAYRLLARLGAGGMGQVYLARSDRGRTVAVKLVRQELAEQEEFRARFRREVRAARRVGGHWTAPVLDADTEAAIPWVATGYVAGPSLQEVVGHDHGALPERSVRILAAGLAHALKDIHAAGLIHRDLKPSNVLVTIDGPRVIDFGIARALESVTDGGLTRTGALVGSPGFMAPEQVRGDRVTPACDVFCLGSVLSYAATGVLPFGAANSGAHALMFRIAQEEPDLEGVPEGIADLVRQCLRKDPASRPTLDDILERTGAEDTVADGRSRDPWLPGMLVAQLGRHAVRLLDSEDPEVAPRPTTEDESTPARPPTPLAAQVPPSALPPTASPEHAPTPDASSLPVPDPPAGVHADHLPTMTAAGPPTPPPAAPPTPTPAPGPLHPAYGYPQQHPQPGAWSTPPYGPTPYGPTPPYGGGFAPRPEPEPPRRNGRSTAVLIVVALVVALGAGASVYALMKGNGDGKAGADPRASRTTGAPTPGPSTGKPSTQPPATGKETPADGAIPTGYLGTWTASIDNATGRNTRQLTIRQGEVGATVLSLTADGDTYHCVFRASLAEAPSDGGPLRIGPSEVTVGEPATSCTPGAETELTLLPDGRLRRVNSNNGDALTYTKQ